MSFLRIICCAFVLVASVESLCLAERPNVILIFIDDLGWKDIGCYGNSFIDTPHIDQLAADGMRFTDFYAAGAVCSPTRCALQAGQNQARIGITAHIPGHWRPFERVLTPLTTMALPLDTVTVAESLREVGYTTGYIGKWHLGGSGFEPSRQGYDFTSVISGPHLPGRYRVQGKTGRQPKAGQYRTEFEADLCVDFIRENSEEPFFLMVSPFAVHIPLGAMSEKVDRYKQRAKDRGVDLPHPVYAAMVEHCDDLVGRIVAEVDRQKLTDNTMIVFTFENGGLYRRYDYREHADDNVATQAPLKGEKGTLYEGGVRVPFIVRYPSIVQRGTVCSEPTISYDFFPTFVELAGGRLPANQTIDGYSLVPLLKDPAGTLERDALHWHYPHYHHGRPAGSIRARDWKLIEYLDGTGDVELYHLAADIGESRNLVDIRPGKAAALKQQLRQWRVEVSARMPVLNPGYNPKRAAEWWSLRTGKPVDSDSRKRFPPTELDL
jgi:uncharacterized sulfatase